MKLFSYKGDWMDLFLFVFQKVVIWGALILFLWAMWAILTGQSEGANPCVGWDPQGDRGDYCRDLIESRR